MLMGLQFSKVDFMFLTSLLRNVNESLANKQRRYIGSHLCMYVHYIGRFTSVDLSLKPTRMTFWKYCASQSTPSDCTNQKIYLIKMGKKI